MTQAALPYRISYRVNVTNGASKVTFVGLFKEAELLVKLEVDKVATSVPTWHMVTAGSPEAAIDTFNILAEKLILTTPLRQVSCWLDGSVGAPRLDAVPRPKVDGEYSIFAIVDKDRKIVCNRLWSRQCDARQSFNSSFGLPAPENELDKGYKIVKIGLNMDSATEV